MTRITISLPNDLAATLTQEARRRSESLSGVVREALRRHLEGTDAPAPSLGFIALGRSGRRHTARDAEKILGREWDRDRSR